MGNPREIERTAQDVNRRVFLGEPIRGALLWSFAGSTADAMVQYWTPDDMLFFVDKAQKGNATSVLEMMDKAAETSWMMNMGPEKAGIISRIIEEKQPERVLEVGTFLGYMTISMAQALPDNASVVTIEKDETNHAAAVKIMTKALGNLENARVPVESWLGASSEVLESAQFRKRHKRGLPFELVLFDHWKPEYATDLRRLERLGYVGKGTVFLADNVIFPGAPELLSYLGVPFSPVQDKVSGQECLAPSEEAGKGTVFESNGWQTKLLTVPFEYRPDTPDAVSYSVRL
eukprot:CAMPEP_0172596518 /NCGR_PEP_ID=MMETSP1068-20121228/16328_1 /TAXON_ID=35684 /ORGANISM="Pseudopedinella elastica, Strain CCMP716" /LENGTH=288 /DNA_ID=CAMNT_0013395589 /DNA_START=206 /DNA_END=1072 /DNA_ORIENTATION=-